MIRVGVAVVRNGRNVIIPPLGNDMNYKKLLFVFSVLFLVGISLFPRGVEVWNHNYIFGFDQGRDYLAAKDIVDNHNFTLIGPEIGAGSAGFQYIFHGPGYFYLLTIPYMLFQGDPYGGVVLMFVLGLLSIGLAFYFGKKMLGIWGGYVFALLIAISPPLIDQSRFIWNSYPTTALIILYFYLVYASIKKSFPFIFLAGFVAAFIYNFELALAAPLCVGLLFFYIVIQREKKIKSYVSLFAGFIVGYLPMILFEIRHGFLGIKGLFSYLLTAHPSADSSFNTVMFLDHFQSFKHNFINAFPVTEPWVMYLFFFVLVSASFYVLRKEKNVQLKKTIIYLLCLPLITFFILSFLQNSVWQHYLYHLGIIYLFLFAYVLVALQKSKKQLFFVVFALFFVWFVIRGIIFAYTITTHDFKDYYGGTAKIQGKIDAIDYIYQDAKGEPFSLFVFSPPIYTYPYEYVVQWYAAKKYGYVPGQEKKGLFYLLIEKDGSKPWTYEGWLETVIKTGEVQKTIIHEPSTFIIQKRYSE